MKGASWHTELSNFSPKFASFYKLNASMFLFLSITYTHRLKLRVVLQSIANLGPG